MLGLLFGICLLSTSTIAVILPVPVNDVCTFNPFVNGCSIPGHLPAPFKVEFTPACNRHDICYACGASNTVPKEICDQKFLLDMRTLCETKPIIDKQICDMMAHVYHDSVATFGHSHYHQTSHSWCKLPWIQLFFLRNVTGTYSCHWLFMLTKLCL